jgi:hypothetical protein
MNAVTFVVGVVVGLIIGISSTCLCVIASRENSGLSDYTENDDY